MSRPASRNARQPTDPAVAVVLHRSGGRWHALAARREEGTLRVLETRTFSESSPGPAAAVGATPGGAHVGESIQAELTRWVEARSPGKVVAVLPASRVICRSCPLPNQANDRLMGALQLQAEAHLLGAVPPHRLGMAILPAGPGDTGRTGLLVGWPEAGEPVEQPFEGALADEATWIPDVAALAALASGVRPSTPLLWIDRTTGALALALAHPGGMTFRATREEFSHHGQHDGQPDGQDDAHEEAWKHEVIRVVGETALSAGQPPAELRELSPRLMARLADAPAAALLLPDEVRQAVREAVNGVPDASAWWNDYGIALGAAMAALSPGGPGDLAALAGLRAAPKRERPSPVARAAAALSEPRTAGALLLLALVLLAFGPLAFARLRLAVLQAKVPDVRALQAANTEDSRRRAMYAEMRRQTWSMTKLLADIANCAPEGIELISISLNRGDAVTINGLARPHGEAKASDRVLEMTRLMEATGIFDRPKASLESPNAMGALEFRINAMVGNPFLDHRYPEEQDFAVTSLAERKYGEAAAGARSDGGAIARAPDEEQADGSAAPTEVASAAAPGGRRSTSVPRPSRGGAADDEGQEDEEAQAEDEESDAAGSDRRGLARRGGGTAAGAATRGGRVAAAPAEAVPEPITQEQVNAMTKAEAQAHLSKVAMARQSIPELENDDENKALRERLRQEFDMLMRRVKEAN